MMAGDVQPIGKQTSSLGPNSARCRMGAGQLTGPTGAEANPHKRGLAGIPDKINNNGMLDIRSNVTGGLDGGDQETVGGDEGGPAQPARGQPGHQQTR